MLEAARPLSRFERMYLAVGERLSRSLYAEVAGAPSLRPRLTLSKIAAFAFAAFVHALTLIVAVLGVVLLLRGWPSIVLIVLGVLCLATAWRLRPEFPALSETVVPRPQLPALYALTDRIAAMLKTSPIEAIVVAPDYNAAMGRYGLRWRKVLYVGLPLFVALDPRERVAVLAHELAHSVNGDSNRGFFVGAAINSLLTWHYLLRPDSIIPEEGGLTMLATIPYNLALLGLAQLMWLGVWLLSHLLWRDSQRAEYLADHFAAGVAGSEAAQTMLEKLYYAPLYERTVQHVSLNRTDETLFDELKRQVAGVSEQDRDAIKTRLLDEAARPDVTHPPTPYRIAFLASRPALEPSVDLSSAESEEIDRELRAFHAPIRRRILDAHRRGLEVAYY